MPIILFADIKQSRWSLSSHVGWQVLILFVDFEPTIMKLETFQWKEAQYIFGCTLSDSVVPDA